MRLNSVGSWVAAGVLSLAVGGVAHAATMFGFDKNVGLNNRSDGNWMIGDKFTVSTGIVISALGVQGVNSSGAADGTFFTEPLQVGLWTADGQTLLASANVMHNDSAPDSSGYVYHTLEAPVPLAAGSYIIAAHVGGGIAYFLDSGGDAFVSLDSTITFNQSMYGNFAGNISAPNTAWDTGWVGGRMNVAPANALFTVVPEPTSLGALMLAGLMLRRRRSNA